MRGLFAMKSFRSNIKSGVRLALFALSVQFALSFGHFHAIAAPSHAKAIQSALPSATQADTGKLAVAKRAQPQGKQDGSRQRPDGCAICAVVAMAGTVVFASPPILLLPEAVELLYRSTDAEFVHLKSAGIAFPPRAPPAS